MTSVINNIKYPSAILLLISFTFSPLIVTAAYPVSVVSENPGTAQFILEKGWEVLKKGYQLAIKGFTAISSAVDTWKQSKDLATWLLGQILYQFIHQMLTSLTNDVIKWIQNDGQTRFVSKGFDDWLGSAVDAVSSDFITNYLGAGWLCQSFDQQLRKAFEIQNQQSRTGANIRLECTLDKFLANVGSSVTDFQNDFSKGGWPAWIEINKKQSNFYGTFLTAYAENEKIKAKEAGERATELQLGQGYLNLKDCYWYDADIQLVIKQEDVYGTCRRPADCDPSTKDKILTKGGWKYPCTYKVSYKTPAATVKSIADKATTNFYDELNVQLGASLEKLGPYQIYVRAIMDALIGKLINKTGDTLFGLKDTPQEFSPAQPMGSPYTPAPGTPGAEGPDQSTGKGLIEILYGLKLELKDRLDYQQQYRATWQNVLIYYNGPVMIALDSVIAACVSSSASARWAETKKTEVINEIIPRIKATIAELDDEIKETKLIITTNNEAITALEAYSEGDIALKATAISKIQTVVEKITGLKPAGDLTTLLTDAINAYEQISVTNNDLFDLLHSEDFPIPGSSYVELESAKSIETEANNYVKTCLAI